MNSKSLGLLVLMPLLGLILLGAAAQEPQAQDIESARLQEERQQVLQEILQIERERFTMGMCTAETLIRTERELLAAQLESAQSKDERVILLEASLKLVKQLESGVAAQVEAAQKSKEDLLRVKASRLLAEIQLRKAQRE